ncbi:MAG TPA: ABC transporter permease [Candidatus Anoxymicrobiaceae bacterium]
MKLILDIGQLFKRKMLETLRNPIFIIVSMTTPIVYLALFAPLLNKLTNVPGFVPGHVLNVFIPGLLVIIAFLGGLFVGYTMIDEVKNGVVERMRVTPTSRFALLAGRVLRDLVNVTVIVVFFVLIALPFGFQVNILGFLVLLVLIAMMLIITSSFSNAMGLILGDEDKLSPVVQAINLPVLLLSGMLLPMELAPKWLQVIAHFNPAYYVVEAGRLLTAGHIFVPKVGYAFLFMVPTTVIVVAWATRAFQRSIA